MRGVPGGFSTTSVCIPASASGHIVSCAGGDLARTVRGSGVELWYVDHDLSFRVFALLASEITARWRGFFRI